MPQMAPIGWLSLFIVFSTAFITFNIMNYYSYLLNSPKSKTDKMSQKYMNWKW